MSIEPEAARDVGRADASSVAAINLKIPPFWPAKPHVRFAQVEAQFSTRGITAEKKKFDHIVASLSPDFATEVRDLILQPPVPHPYTTWKEQLIRRTAALEQRRLQQLITTEELGDRTPSQLLRKMQQLLGSHGWNFCSRTLSSKTSCKRSHGLGLDGRHSQCRRIPSNS